MPSLYVPPFYRVLDRKHGGWTKVSDLVGKYSECWSGDAFCPVRAKKIVTDCSVLLVDAVTILGAAEKTESVVVSYKWPAPPVKTFPPSSSSCTPTCFLRDHEVLAFKDFATKKKDMRNGRDYYIVPIKRCHALTFIKSALHKVVGKSLVIYEDDIKSSTDVCENGMTRCGQLHMQHYVDVALSLKGNLLRATKWKREHTEIVDSHLPMASWRRLRRALAVCGVTNNYSFKVRRICTLRGVTKRRVRLLLSAPDFCRNVKEKLPHVERISAVKSKQNRQKPITWIELFWKEEDEYSETMIVEGVRLWPILTFIPPETK